MPLLLHLLTLLLLRLPLLFELLALRRLLPLLLHLLTLLFLRLPLLVELLALRRLLPLLIRLLALLFLRLPLLFKLLTLRRLLPLLIRLLALLFLRLPLLVELLALRRLLTLLLYLLALLLLRHALLVELLPLQRLLTLGLLRYAAHLVGTLGRPTASLRCLCGLTHAHIGLPRHRLRGLRPTTLSRLAGIRHGHRTTPRRPCPCRPPFTRKATRQFVRPHTTRRMRGNGLALETVACHLRQPLRPRAADQAGLDRRNRRRAATFSHRQMAPFLAGAATRHRPPLDKVTRWHARDGTRHITVDPSIMIASANPGVVVNGDVVDRVDSRDIGRAGAIHRPVHVARPQRIPRHARPATDRDRRGHAANETDHGRHVARPHRDRPGHPSPAAAEVGPAAVVRWREAPGLVIDPGPSPRRHPGPVPGAIRRPVRRHLAREPHRTVAGVLLPVAIVIKRGVPGHVGRHVARRYRPVLAPIARRCPPVEAVGHRVVARPRIGQVGAGKPHALATAHLDRACVAVEHGAAMAHRHHSGGAVGRNVEPVVAGFARHEGQVRGIHLHLLVLRQRAHAQLQRALRQLDLRGVIVKIQDARGGAAAQPDRGGPRMQFGTAARVHPEPVTGGHGPVQSDGRPIVGACRRETQPAGLVGDRGDP